MNFSKMIRLFTGLFLLLLVTVFSVGGRAAIKIGPGDLDHFVLTVPEKATAGESFTLKLEVRDAYDNIIVDYNSKGKPISLAADGKGVLVPGVIGPSDFFQGIARILVKYNKAGEVNITVREKGSGKSESGKMKIGPAGIHRFSVSAPSKISAGREFDLEVKTLDVYGNVVVDYTVKHSGVEIVMGPDGRYRKILPPSAFVRGVASVGVTYEKTGTITARVTDLTEDAEGKSKPILIEPAKADRFFFVLPDRATAGKPFTAKIKAHDAFGNLVTNYDKTGKGVVLNPKANGTIIPDKVPASAFVEGIATVNLVYDKAEIISPEVTETGREIKAPGKGKKPAKGITEKKAKKKKQEAAEKKAVKKTEPKELAGDPRAEAKRCHERAVKYIGQRKYKDAKIELEKCLSLDPGNAETKKLLNRVSIILRLGSR